MLTKDAAPTRRSPIALNFGALYNEAVRAQRSADQDPQARPYRDFVEQVYNDRVNAAHAYLDGTLADTAHVEYLRACRGEATVLHAFHCKKAMEASEDSTVQVASCDRRGAVMLLAARALADADGRTWEELVRDTDEEVEVHSCVSLPRRAFPVGFAGMGGPVAVAAAILDGARVPDAISMHAITSAEEIMAKHQAAAAA